MKKLSKILCAVLVIAMLCSSLIFMVGAEEEEAAPAYTSVPASLQSTLETIKYGAEDNLISSFSRQTNSVNGYNGEGARQAAIVTNTKTGESWYREWFEGDRYLLKGDEVENQSGNEYIQFNFEKQTLTYDAGYNEYIIVDMDLAHSGKTVTIWDRTKYTDSAHVKQEVIGRIPGGSTSWATTQYYKDFGLGDGMKHVTAVYDYSSGNAYIFTNGKLVTTYKNGALTAAITTAYKSGTAVDVSEWRIGSNSADEFHMANAYVRYAKNASAEDGLAAAITSGKLSAWSGNIYDADYKVPTPYWFVKTAQHNELGNWTGTINTTTNSVVDATVAGNLYAGSSSSIGNGVDVLGVKTSTADDINYVTFYGVKDGNIDKKNTFWQFSTVGAPNVSVAAGTSAYYVIDFDIATHSETLPYIDISVMLRRVSDGSGFPFSANIDVAPYVNTDGAWNHITIVGDMAANQCYLYVNGEYVGNPGYAYNASQLSGNTELSPKGIRVDLGLSNATYAVTAGQNFAFDNFAQRVYTDAASSNGLDAAVAAGDLNGWANNAPGNSGRNLPIVATVNGVNYYNTNKLEGALTSNDKLDVEFFYLPLEPVTIRANATVQTNGFAKDDLITLGTDCEIVSEQDGIIVTYAPFIENRVTTQPFTVGGSLSASVYNAIKYDVPGNIFANFTPISLQVGGQYHSTWGQPGFRKGELVTNMDTGDVYYRESSVLLPDGTMADGVVLDANNNIISYKEADKGSNTFVRSNEYVNFNFTRQPLTYEAGKNEYIVIDFDFGTDGVINDVLSVQLIPRLNGSGCWASDIYLKDLPIAPGKMAHITLVFDFSTNNAHVFVDGVFAYSVAEGAMDGEHSGDRTDGNKWKDSYLTGSGFYVQEFKLCSDRRMSTVCFDNVAIRAYDLAVSDDFIGAAVEAGDITTWADSVYNENYKTTKFPAVATVNGVDYGSVDALNEALAIETETAKEVYIKHTPDATIKVLTDANVETNGLACDFDYKTGTYEFIHDDPYYVCTGTNIAKASNRLILAHEENSTVYSFETINKDNCAQYATPVLWFISLDPEDVEVVFYVHGDQIAPFNDDAYIEDGKLHRNEWYTLSQDFEIGAAVSAFPVSSKDCSEAWYFRGTTAVDADFAADDIKQNANISTSGKLNIYVNKSETVTDGKVVVIDGVEYLEFTFDFAPYQIAENFVVEFEVVDENGRVYTQKQNVSFVDYAETLLAGDQPDDIKELVVGMLKYANEAHMLKNGSTIASVDALLDTHADRVPTEVQTNIYNTDDLSSVIRSAAMKLNTVPEFVFKVARGFKGTIEFSYTGINGTTLITETVDASLEEQLIVLKSFGVADIFEDITITATSENGTTVTGKYNLSSYAAGLDSNAAFANALLAYAQTAKKYIANNVRPTYNEDGEVIRYEILDPSAVSNANLTALVTNKIKQWDQSDAHNVHTGTPVYAMVARDNKLVEALYFSKTTPWVGDETEQFSEFRIAINGEKAGPAVTGISFWYLADGTVGQNTRYEFIDLQGNKFFSNGYVQVKTPSNHPLAVDNYPELSGTDYILDGEWHHMVINFEEPIVLIDILFNLYHFQGEFVISDLVFTYAE